ncbi:hypothetical protein EDD11_010308, partial [Mortierella claussenii]
MDDIFAFDDIPHGRTISFTTSWRLRMTQEYSVAYCSLKGEAGSVDKDAIAERMNEIRNICSDYEPDIIYNCDETGMYLKELSNHSYTTEEFTSGAKPERGESRVLVTKEYATRKKITNGDAWSLIPYAWFHVKALTVRHCFCKVEVFSKAQVDKLEQGSMQVEEQPPLYPPVADTDAIVGGEKIQFSLDKNQKDAQDMAEEIKQQVRNKIAERYSSRGRGSSIERDVVQSFMSKHGDEPVATMLVEWLG